MPRSTDRDAHNDDGRESDGRNDNGQSHGRLADVVVVAVAVVVGAPYLIAGPGFVLDDWFSLGEVTVGGPFAAAGAEQWLARPGAAFIYAFTFGVLGARPVLHLVLQLAIMAGTAFFLRRVAARRWSPSTGLAIAVAWLLVPNHTSLIAWPSAVNIGVALLLTVAAWWMVGARTGTCNGTRPAVVCGVLLALATLCYEAVAPAGVLVALALGWPRRWRASEWRAVEVIAIVVPTLVALAWIVVFWHPSKAGVDETIDATLVVPAHLGWGVFPTGGVEFVLGTVALVSIVVIVARRVDPRRRHATSRGEHMVVAGVVVIAVGTAPFVRYFYQPLGPGDRMNVVASIGTALVWVGLVDTLRVVVSHRVRRPQPVIALVAAVLAVLFIAGQIDAAMGWSSASAHARAELVRLRAEGCPDGEPLVVPRGPIRRNVVAFLDASNIRGLARVSCDGEVKPSSLSIVRYE